MKLSYKISLGPPTGFPDEAAGPPVGIHDLEIAWRSDQSFRVRRERLTFSEPLAVAHALSTRGENAQAREYSYEPSSFSWARSIQNNLRVETTPRLRSRNLKLFLDWLGFSHFLRREVSSVPEIRAMITGISARPDGDELPRDASFIELGAVPAMAFASQIMRFRFLGDAIKRYDLQLIELRREQPITIDQPLTAQGKNMASVLRDIQQSEDSAAAQRIQDTLEALAPHVASAATGRLRSAKEFVEFMESETGRPVESWDSSDGTLRALAILLAVESHEPGGTLLIEEPELGLHPWAVRALMEHIRAAVEERAVQVVMTTHSQQVLEEVRPEEVLVAARTVEQGTSLHNLSDILPPDHQVRMGDVGRMWVKGLFGGVPGDE
jgi:hypothetical protein